MRCAWVVHVYNVSGDCIRHQLADFWFFFAANRTHTASRFPLDGIQYTHSHRKPENEIAMDFKIWKGW